MLEYNKGETGFASIPKFDLLITLEPQLCKRRLVAKALVKCLVKWEVVAKSLA